MQCSTVAVASPEAYPHIHLQHNHKPSQDLPSWSNRADLAWMERQHCREHHPKFSISPPLELFKAGLVGALNNLACGRCPWALERCWKEVVFKIPSNQNHSMILFMCSCKVLTSNGLNRCHSHSTSSQGRLQSRFSFCRPISFNTQ